MAKLTGMQKAAVLMVTLGDETASNIFKYLEEDEIQTISREIAITKHVQPEVAEEVMEEFHTMTQARSYISQGGIEYAKKLLIKSVGPEVARKIIDRLVKALESSAGFTSLERANPQQLSKFIQNEHPQTIALILAHLNASQAAELISSLPEVLRSDVAMRMASLQEISPEVVRRISLILEQKLEALGSFATEAYGGVRAVAELFNRMDRNTGRAVLEKIETENPQLAASIRDLMFVFDDILLIDDNGITEILKRADKKTLTIALKGTSEELQNQFFRNMSSRAVELMKEEMEFMGPVKLKDVEKSQHEVVEIVRQLEEEGVISIGGGGGEDYVT
ncbi:MAG: flagellar motor switch protein FliG [Geothrix sp.]|uniref:Flagellar motor switch protein FliG n=1 Tax=Candidatus Geothrix skivensis TaxID=2954439 RepID=A0A9D7XFJ6_9BACT|nr:flagellar motor switch protein FliG [Geothrix sp.]MBK9795196.1 flagellar motor switch protein FliG [Candidatus Geothrix skivensis]NWJ40518.1 flagellar motor switch protein FliG [Geothrix sp.]WIL21477.1 MAG: flagellar motor switch protein FliG [Geothrix sp.]